MQYFFIGERELVLAFGLVGVQGEIAVTRDEVLTAFNRATGRDPSLTLDGGRPKVIILTQNAVSLIEDEVKEWQMSGKAPLIVDIPGIHGHLEGRKSLSDAIREAVGIQI